VFRHLAMLERASLLRSLAEDFVVHPGLDVDAVAVRMSNLPTATLVHVFDEAAFVAARDGHDAIEDSDLREAVSRLRVGLARSRPWDPDELRRAAIHEAGHAVAQLALGRTVGWVEVDARQDGALGSMFGPERDVGSMTEHDVLDRLTVAIAGRTAEIIVTGVTDVGSASDLRSATALAVRAAKEWGFSRRGLVITGDYAEAIVEGRVDDAVATLLERAEIRAGEILRAHRDALDVLTAELVLRRHLGRREVEHLLAGLVRSSSSVASSGVVD
jgi:cell division protease FtsH